MKQFSIAMFQADTDGWKRFHTGIISCSTRASSFSVHSYCTNTSGLEDYHCLSGQGNQDHSQNGTGLGTRHEIKPLLSQNHVHSPSFLPQSQPLTLLAQHSQALLAPWSIANVLAICQPQAKERVIPCHLRETQVYRSLCLGTWTPSRYGWKLLPQPNNSNRAFNVWRVTSHKEAHL